MGRKFELRIDHQGLKYLFEQQNLNARQERWLQLLCEFDFKIKHVRGKENKVMDALSRRMHVMHVVAISTCNSDLKSIILEDLIWMVTIYRSRKGYNKDTYNKSIRILDWNIMKFLCTEIKFMFSILVR